MATDLIERGEGQVRVDDRVLSLKTKTALTEMDTVRKNWFVERLRKRTIASFFGITQVIYVHYR